MKTYKYIICSTILLCATTAAAQGFNFVEPQAASSANEARQADAYAAGQQAMNENRWEQAVERFDQAVRAGGSRSAAATYWKAYSLNKAGRREEAIAVATQCTRDFPQSRYAKDCGALLLETGGTSARVVADKDPDEDLKLLAIRRLCEQDEERCVPLVRKFIENPAYTAKAKEKVMFILAQSDSPAAQQLMGEIARGQVYPALQVKAIHNLGIHGNESNMKTLSEIYASAPSTDVKKRILEAFGIAGQRGRLLDAAKAETDPELQKRAINGLGIAGGRQELLDLYKASANATDKRIMILNAMMIAGAHEALNEIAVSEPDQKVRLKAIRTLGITGGKKTGPALLAIYNNNPDEETRKAVIDALFVSGDSTPLIELAKKETDPKVKRRLVEKIALMGDKASRDYMIQILEQ